MNTTTAAQIATARQTMQHLIATGASTASRQKQERIINQLLAKGANEDQPETTPEPVATPLRLAAALADITAATDAVTGVDLTSCCRSCAVEVGTRNYLVAWVYKARWIGNKLHGLDDDGSRYVCSGLRFNYAQIATARKAVRIFRQHGFTVEWSGDYEDCVIVKLP